MVMRALVTGGNGFVGSALIGRILEETSWNIVSLERLPAGRGVQDARVMPLYHDLLAPLDCSRIGKVEVMVHCTAEVSRARALVDPMKSVAAAVLCTQHALEAARVLKPSVFVLVSSGEVLGTVPEGKAAEEDWPLRPEDPYAAGKASAELLARSYSLCFGVPVTIIRAMNLFGPGMPLDRFLPKLTRAVVKGEELRLTASIRNWMPVGAFLGELLGALSSGTKRSVETLHVVGPVRSAARLLELAEVALDRRARFKDSGLKPERFVLKGSSSKSYEDGFDASFMDAVRWYA